MSFSFLLVAFLFIPRMAPTFGRILYFPCGRNQGLVNSAGLLAWLLFFISKTGLVCFCYFVSPAIDGDSKGGGWLVEVIGASKRASTYSEVVHLCLPVCDT
ncbi:hypothetical protein B0T18DRAFT_18669 [Schizothecium vesticola]|uniref:Uncharacterized protein n=1 Tax=Schizothecium vesticola TaxID=314040 RepID=A0AA40F9B7_9PEZI|nr:hypothetical protein B0T18DRAFT_18669 [Schizothecium vesticola]